MENLVFIDDDKALIIEHLYTVENYLTLRIKIKSGEFAGASNFCIPTQELISIIKTLSEMNNKLSGCCTLRDYDTDANIIFEMHKFGHVSVFGQIGGSHEDHFMRFKYMLDQTVLTNLIQILEAID